MQYGGITLTSKNYSYMAKYFLILLLSITINTSFGQQKTLAKFIITEASINKVDKSETILDQRAYSVFYINKDGSLYMANVWAKNNSQSFGRLYSRKRTKLKEKYKDYYADISHFKWRYINDYNLKKGSATIKFIKIYKPEGVTFLMTIKPKKQGKIIYTGFMEGTLDLSEMVIYKLTAIQKLQSSELFYTIQFFN